MGFVGMGLFGKVRSLGVNVVGVVSAALLLAGGAPQVQAQQAPYVLPYTMSTFAGPVASLTIGQACGAYFALDVVGDGCPAKYVSVGSDPHDIRVDAKGNVFWMDNSSKEVVHKISAVTGLETTYAGSAVQTKVCSTGNGDKYGDGCVSTDGAANSGTATYYTGSLPKSRGLATAANGDVFLADYGGNYDHKISAATGVMSVIAGTGTAGDVDSPTGSAVNTSRGVGVDSLTGNVYIADTANNVIRMVTPAGTISTITAQYAGSVGLGSAGCPTARVLSSGVAIGQAYMCAPEDVQVDMNGNIFIGDAGDNLVRVVYGGKSTNFFGIVSPVAGYVYTIAGFNVYSPGAPTAATAYPTGGVTPTVSATNTSMGIRKISVDARGNLYIADAANNVVWFVDAATGYLRLLAGIAGGTAGSVPTTAPCSAATNNYGDGCPGPVAFLYTSGGSDAANAVDNQGNLYITDSEGSSSAATARLRKLLSGLNFPATNTTTTTTQTVLIHFGPGDSAATTGAFTSTNTDFVVGTPTCGAANADTTSDCTVPIKFTPTKAGADTSTLVVTSKLGGVNSYVLTGTGTAPQLVIDPGNAAVLTTPTATSNAQGVVLDGAGNAYVADTNNNRVLKYTLATTTWSTFAGTGVAGYSGDSGLAIAATLKAPSAVAVDNTGSVYIADTGNNVIRKVTVAGTISTYAGGATTVCSQATDAMGDGCPGTGATFSKPSGLAADNLGQIYVSDTGNNLVRQINVLGFVSLLAGGSTTPCTAKTDTFGDGCTGSQVSFSGPTGLAFDATGNYVLVADTGHNIVRKIATATTFGYSGTGATTLASGIELNAVSLVAGNGQGGGSVDVSGLATLSSITAPTGVAVDAAENVYIADTGDAAIRLVNSSTGIISTIMGINGTSGTGTVPGPATSAQLLSPGGVAVTPTGTLYVLDSGNNRVLTDTRSQVTYNFGRVNIGFSGSPVQTFTETSIGTAPATLATAAATVFTGSGNTTLFTLTSPTGSTGCPTTAPSGAAATLAVGASCVVQGQFNPVATGTFSATYTETTASATAGVPSITLQGIGAVLTSTTGAVTQTVPATGNSQFGGSLTVSATITPASCNTAAPSCVPTGTVKFVVDTVVGGPIQMASGSATVSQVLSGLAVGPHVISCLYSGDNFYAADSCPNVTITVGQASTTSLLAASPNNQTQYPTTSCVTAGGITTCTATLLVATVVSNTTGTPTGSVSFYANGSTTPLISTQVTPTTGVASIGLTYAYDANHNLLSDTTLAPGTYTLTCKYSGSSNYLASSCAGLSFTVLPTPAAFTLVPRGCTAANLIPNGSTNPGEGVAPSTTTSGSGSGGCISGTEVITSGVPTVSTAEGSTTDATIFINATNTVAGTLTFKCSGLPAASTCTFSPTSVTLSAGTTLPTPAYTDVTLWTDLQPGYATSSLRKPSLGDGKGGVELAMMLGWPLTLAGLAGVVSLRRKRKGLNGMALLAMLVVMFGSTLALTSCAGPGLYNPVLTPAGTYPITITVTGDGITATTVVNFKVTSPGFIGQE